MSAPPPYSWLNWRAEVENGNDDDRRGVFYLTIVEGTKKLAIIEHRTFDGKFPLNGGVATGKTLMAQCIVDALNKQQA